MTYVTSHVRAPRRSIPLGCETMTVQPNGRPPSLPAGGACRYHTMIKPASTRCNLDCPFCFYLHKIGLRGHRQNVRMSDEVLEPHVRPYIEANTGEEVVFSWRGGEPTLMELARLEKAMEVRSVVNQ